MIKEQLDKLFNDKCYNIKDIISIINDKNNKNEIINYINNYKFFYIISSPSLLDDFKQNNYKKHILKIIILKYYKFIEINQLSIINIIVDLFKDEKFLYNLKLKESYYNEIIFHITLKIFNDPFLYDKKISKNINLYKDNILKLLIIIKNLKYKNFSINDIDFIFEIIDLNNHYLIFEDLKNITETNSKSYIICNLFLYLYNENNCNSYKTKIFYNKFNSLIKLNKFISIYDVLFQYKIKTIQFMRFNTFKKFVFKMLNLSNIGNIYILENILNEINKTTLDPKFKKFIENMILIQKISGE